MKLKDAIWGLAFTLVVVTFAFGVVVIFWGGEQNVETQATTVVQLAPQLWEVEIAQVYSDKYDDFLIQKWEPFGVYHLDERSGRRYIVAFKRPITTEK